MNDLGELKKAIEQLREQLKETGQNHRLTDPEMIGASQLLDAVLNEYEKLLRKRDNETE